MLPDTACWCYRQIDLTGRMDDELDAMKRWLLPLSVLILIVAMVTAIATQLIPTRPELHWDEATHSLKASVIAYDLAQGDWLSFALNSYRQVRYPPLHSWILAAVFLLRGTDITSVSLVSLGFYALGAGLLYLAGGQLARGRPNIIGAVAALLWLTSPTIVDYSIQGMLEMPGLAALCLVILIFLKLLADDEVQESDVRAPAPREYMLLGAAIAITYFLRVPYGIIPALAIGLTLLLRARLRPLRLWRPEIFYLLLPLVIIFGLWFAYIPKFTATLDFLVNYADGVDPYTTSGILFYPRTLVDIAGTWWLFALYMAGAVVALFFALVRWQPWGRRLGAAFLALLIVVQLVIGLGHLNKQARYMFPVLPAYFLLAGYLFDVTWRWARGRRPRVAQAIWGVVLVAVVVQSGLFVVAAMQPGRGVRPDEVTPYVTDWIDGAPSTLVIGSMEMTYPSPPLLDWELGRHGYLAMPQSGAAAQVDEGRKLAGLAQRLPLPQASVDWLVQTVTGYDQPAPLHTLYVGLPNRASYSQGWPGYRRFVQETVAAQAVEQVVVISRTDKAGRYPRAELEQPLLANGWVQVAEQPFDGVRMVISVFVPATN